MCLKSIIKVAIEEAEKSNFRYRVGAVIFKSNRIYSKGHNFQSRSNNNLHPKLRHPYYTIHAEIDAISNLNRVDCSNLDILIVRVAGKKIKRLAMAKPCIHCQKALRFMNFRRIYFSNEISQIEVFSDEC